MTAHHVVTTPARDLTPEQAEERKSLCADLDRRVRGSMRSTRETLWDLARDLYEFDTERGWSALGGYDTLGDWLADPEVGMTKSQYYRLVGVWREMVVERRIDPRQLSDLDLTKVEIVLPALKAGTVTVAVALADVRGSTAEKLRADYVPQSPNVGTSALVANVGGTTPTDEPEPEEVVTGEIVNAEPGTPALPEQKVVKGYDDSPAPGDLAREIERARRVLAAPASKGRLKDAFRRLVAALDAEGRS